MEAQDVHKNTEPRYEPAICCGGPGAAYFWGAALILLGATMLGVELGLIPSAVHGLTGPMMLVLFGLFVLLRALKRNDQRW